MAPSWRCEMSEKPFYRVRINALLFQESTSRRTLRRAFAEILIRKVHEIEIVELPTNLCDKKYSEKLGKMMRQYANVFVIDAPQIPLALADILKDATILVYHAGVIDATPALYRVQDGSVKKVWSLKSADPRLEIALVEH